MARCRFFKRDQWFKIMPEQRSILLSAREWCAEVLATFVADSSPNPFNPRAACVEGDAAFLDLTFQVEAELRAKIGGAPPDFVEAALSLLTEKPPANWPGWTAFNGLEDWDYALEKMLKEFARLHPDRFFHVGRPLLQNPTARAKIIGAMSSAACSVSTEKELYKERLARFISEPSELTADEIWALEDLLSDAEKVVFSARLSENQKIALQEFKRRFGEA